MPARAAQRRPLFVANARRSPGYGCALRRARWIPSQALRPVPLPMAAAQAGIMSGWRTRPPRTRGGATARDRFFPRIGFWRAGRAGRHRFDRRAERRPAPLRFFASSSRTESCHETVPFHVDVVVDPDLLRRCDADPGARLPAGRSARARQLASRVRVRGHAEGDHPDATLGPPRRPEGWPRFRKNSPKLDLSN